MSNRLHNAKHTDKYFIVNDGQLYKIIKKTNGSKWNVFFSEDPQKIWDFKMANKINIERNSWMKFYKEFKGE